MSSYEAWETTDPSDDEFQRNLFLFYGRAGDSIRRRYFAPIQVAFQLEMQLAFRAHAEESEEVGADEVV